MSKKKEDGEGKKKGGMMMKIILVVGLLAAGGGGVFGLMAAGVIGGHEEKKEQGPALVRKDEDAPYAPAKEGAEAGIEMVHGEGGSEFRTAYYAFSDDFTSNLKNSDSLVQVSLAASTRRDGRVLMWLTTHELAIRSRLLVELADTPEELVFTPEGKKELQKRLTKAINEVLIEEEGFGGVDNVHFRSFIVQ